MSDFEVAPIAGLRCWPQWEVNYPYLKLALKYGLVGPWKGALNRSVQFDAYSLSRGPNKGEPNSVDLLATGLMNSGVSQRHLTWLEGWLGGEENSLSVRSLMQLLGACSSLDEMPEKTVDALGDFVDRMIRDDSNAGGNNGGRIFGGSKVCKWLSAWACYHVPMIDTLLHDALARSRWPHSPECGHSAKLLSDFKEIVVCHYDQLCALGQQLCDDLNGLLPAPVPPVRVLDSLLWFDWALRTKAQFNGVWFRYRTGRNHELLGPGIEFVQNRGRKSSVGEMA